MMKKRILALLLSATLLLSLTAPAALAGEEETEGTTIETTVEQTVDEEDTTPPETTETEGESDESDDGTQPSEPDSSVPGSSDTDDGASDEGDKTTDDTTPPEGDQQVTETEEETVVETTSVCEDCGEDPCACEPVVEEVTDVTADVYTMTETGEYEKIAVHSATLPLDMKNTYNGQTVYILEGEENQNVYFECKTPYGLDILGAEFSLDSYEYASVTADGALIGSSKATVTVSSEAVVGVEIVLTAQQGRDTYTVTIAVIENLPEDDVDELGIPECNCGYSEDDGLDAHPDNCARKAYLRDTYIVENSADDIYTDWGNMDGETQEAVLIFLSWDDQEKLAELNEIIAINTPVIDEELETTPVEELYEMAISTDEDEVYQMLNHISEEKRTEFWQRVNEGLMLNSRIHQTRTFRMARSSNSQSNLLEIGKNVTYKGDRTYEIELTAYSTGQTTTATVVKPADIAIIIDQSGSMLRPVDDKLKLERADLENNETAQKNASHDTYYLAYGNSTVCFLFYQDGDWYYYDTYLLKETISIEGKDGGYCYSGQMKYHPRKDYYGTENLNYFSGGWDNYVPDLAYMKSHLTPMSDSLWNTFTKEENGIWQTRYGATYDALHQFVTNLEESGADHKVAIIGFGGYNEAGSALYVGSNSTQVKVLEAQADGSGYKNGLQSIATEDGLKNVRDAIDALHTNQKTTNCYAGLTIANGIFENAAKSNARDRMTIVFSDGADGSPNNAYPQANELKNTHEVKVYGIAAATATPEFMENLSSNYMYTSGDENIWGKKVSDKYYFGTTSADDLMNAFNTISQDTSSTSVTLGSNTSVRDILTPQFEINAENVDVSAIKVYTRDYQGGGNFATEEKLFTEAIISLSNSDGEVNGKMDTIDVSGFDYSKEFIHEAGSSTGAGGRMLVIKIPIKVEGNFKGGNFIATNTENAGIYTSEGVVAKFPVPHVDIPTTVTIKKSVEGGPKNTFSFNAYGYQKWLGTYQDIPAGTASNTGENASNYLKANGTVVAENKFSVTSGTPATISDILVGSTITIEELDAADYNTVVKVNEDEVLPVDGKYEITVTPGMEIEFINTYKHTKLTIKKEGCNESLDPNQTFIFTVVGMDDHNKSVNMTVVVCENGSVSITDIPLGNYLVTEKEGWSWRYTVKEVSTGSGEDKEVITAESNGGYKVAVEAGGDTVTFSNERDETQWLDGNTWCRNIFDGVITGTVDGSAVVNNEKRPKEDEPASGEE